MAFTFLLLTQKSKPKGLQAQLQAEASLTVSSLPGVGLIFEALETKRLAFLLPRWVGPGRFLQRHPLPRWCHLTL